MCYAYLIEILMYNIIVVILVSWENNKYLISICSAVAIVDGRPLSGFDELLPMAVVTASWWILLVSEL